MNLDALIFVSNSLFNLLIGFVFCFVLVLSFLFCDPFWRSLIRRTIFFIFLRKGVCEK